MRELRVEGFLLPREAAGAGAVQQVMQNTGGAFGADATQDYAYPCHWAVPAAAVVPQPSLLISADWRDGYFQVDLLFLVLQLRTD